MTDQKGGRPQTYLGAQVYRAQAASRGIRVASIAPSRRKK